MSDVQFMNSCITIPCSCKSDPCIKLLSWRAQTLTLCFFPGCCIYVFECPVSEVNQVTTRHFRKTIAFFSVLLQAQTICPPTYRCCALFTELSNKHDWVYLMWVEHVHPVNDFVFVPSQDFLFSFFCTP